MKSKLLKMGIGCFLLLFTVFIVFQCYGLFFDAKTTEQAVEVSANDCIDASATFFRKEQIITNDKTGCMVYSLSNGSKVAKGSEIVQYFDSESSVAAQEQISALEEKITKLKELNAQNSYYIADLSTVSANIKSNLYKYIEQVDDNNFSNISTIHEQLLYYMCQSQLAAGREDNYNDIIESYAQKLASLKDSSKVNFSSLKSEYSGYFVNTADGYENSFDYDKVTQMTVAQLKAIKQKEVPRNSIGKIISQHEWYIATQLSMEDSLSLYEGKSTAIILPISSVGQINVTVAAINKDYKTDSALVVFSCSEMNGELAQMRTQDIRILVKKYKGLRISTDAIRVKDKEKGVFVQVNAAIKFRKINILYSNDEYSIIENANQYGYLKIYDDVIIGGRGLNE